MLTVVDGILTDSFRKVEHTERHFVKLPNHMRNKIEHGCSINSDDDESFTSETDHSNYSTGLRKDYPRSFSYVKEALMIVPKTKEIWVPDYHNNKVVRSKTKSEAKRKISLLADADSFSTADTRQPELIECL